MSVPYGTSFTSTSAIAKLRAVGHQNLIGSKTEVVLRNYSRLRYILFQEISWCNPRRRFTHSVAILAADVDGGRRER